MNAAAIILAAGASTRMGSPKQLLQLQGETLVVRAVRIAGEAGLAPVFVVVGAESDRIKAALAGQRITIIECPDWATGMGASIRAGVRVVAAQADIDAALMTLVDQPFVRASTLRSLVERASPEELLGAACRYAGSIGVPALFKRSTFARIESLPPERGAKVLLESMGASLAIIECPEAALDIDTPEDFHRLSTHTDDAAASVRIREWHGDTAEDRSDLVAREEPLEITVRNRAVSVTMRTPGHDDELAAGFLFTEGLIRARADIDAIEPCTRNEHGNSINIRTAPLVHIDFERLSRHLFASSSCGICGKASIDAIRTSIVPLKHMARVSPAVLRALPDEVLNSQRTFAATGGLHAAALFDVHGRRLCLREDVGRHNAVDKVIGWALLNDSVPLEHHIMLVSGRASFEIMQKAAAAGIQIVAAVSAPSSLAVDFAQEVGQTLIGFLRPPRFNVYSNPERIEGP